MAGNKIRTELIIFVSLIFSAGLTLAQNATKANNIMESKSILSGVVPFDEILDVSYAVDKKRAVWIKFQSANSFVSYTRLSWKKKVSSGLTEYRISIHGEVVESAEKAASIKSDFKKTKTGFYHCCPK
jgi:hypothetical protein